MGANKRKPRGTTLQSQGQNQGWNSAIIAALITATAGILVALISALFNFPPFVGLFQKDPTPTITVTEALLIATETIQSTVSNTATVENDPPTPTFTETSVPTATKIPPTATATSIATAGLPIGMDVQLVTDITSGYSPLTVHFDARSSFLRDVNGDIYNCSVCNYTWYVYQDFNLLNEPQRSSNGTFNYRFSRRGEYRVVVRVCRGQGDSDCGYDAEEISVR